MQAFMKVGGRTQAIGGKGVKTKGGSRDMQAFMTVGGHICMAGRTQAID